MPLISPGRDKLSLSQKVSRLGSRLCDPEWRRYGRLLLTGKMLGLGMVLLIMYVGPTVVSIASSMFSGQTARAVETGGAQPTTASVAATNPAALDASATQPATGPATAPTSAPAAAATTPVMPGDLTDLGKNPTINPINTIWTLVAAFLVFGMQAGFTMLEAGFCRSRETVNVLVECVFDTCLCGIAYYAFGYAFMFGAGNGFIGWHDPTDATKSWLFLKNIVAGTTYGTTGIPVLAHWVFQFAFADCASTICSGTMIGRTAFWGDILYSVCVSGFIYPIIGHWAWGPDGLLATMGGQNPYGFTELPKYTHFLPKIGMNFHDFAGSTVVHSIGGWIALAGGIMLGPRLGRKFKRDGGGPMQPHDLVMGVIGGFILWFGWYGFNPGSSLSAMDFGGIGRIAANTTLAASGGGLVAIFIGYARTKKWDAGLITNGFLAGLVAITCPCYWVSPSGAVALGGVAGVVVILGIELLEFFRIDDPIGAWPVHGLCGIWGTISLGLFATGQYSAAGSSATGIPDTVNKFLADGVTANPAYSAPLTGLFYHGGTQVLVAQCIGSFIICAATFAIAMIVFAALNAVKLLRVSREGEEEGLDIHEHGIPAYPEYVISALAAPRGMPADTVGSHATARTTMHGPAVTVAPAPAYK